MGVLDVKGLGGEPSLRDLLLSHLSFGKLYEDK